MFFFKKNKKHFLFFLKKITPKKPRKAPKNLPPPSAAGKNPYPARALGPSERPSTDKKHVF